MNFKMIYKMNKYYQLNLILNYVNGKKKFVKNKQKLVVLMLQLHSMQMFVNKNVF